MKPLTAEQRVLVEENWGIAYNEAYRMTNKGFVPGTLAEDAVQEATIGLMQAARAYDPGRGLQFSTLAVCCCRNRILRMIQQEKRQTRISGVSLDATIGEETARLMDMIPAPDDTEAEAVPWLNDAVHRILADDDKPHYALMLMDYAFGRPMADIARERGVSRQLICRQISRARDVLREARAQGKL